MTVLLEKAFTEVSRFSDIEQNLIAQWLLDEIASEKKWGKAFAESEDILGMLAEDALKQHRRGKTQILNPDQL